ncbi:MAG: hypothetical protein ACK4IX_18435, partial [Candidatus Sericytochromatia bacterium]
FITAGFVAVDMEAAGKKVTSFSKPVDVKVGISTEIENLETGQKIHEGDKIPTWSYESATGEWKEEGEAIVTKGSDGKLTATFKVSHLSYWNISWFYYSNRVCLAQYSLIANSNLTTQFNSSSEDYQTFMYFVNSAGRRIFRGNGKGVNVLNGGVSYYYTGPVPRGLRIQFDVIRTFDNLKVGSSGVINPCVGSGSGFINTPLTITIPQPFIPYLNVEIDFTVECSNKSINIKPSNWVHFFDALTKEYHYAYVTNGQGSVKLREGREYKFEVYYDGKNRFGRATFGKDSYKIITTSGQGISGTTTYDNYTGATTLLASYTANDCK